MVALEEEIHLRGPELDRIGWLQRTDVTLSHDSAHVPLAPRLIREAALLHDVLTGKLIVNRESERQTDWRAKLRV